MPKRKVPTSLLPPDVEDSALAAIREALKHPKAFTAEEERDFLERRARGLAAGTISRHEYIVTMRRGMLVYREHGKAGADLPVPPYYMAMLNRRRDFETEAAKVDRKLTMMAHNRLRQPTARTEKAAELKCRVMELGAVDTARGRYKRIARDVGCSVVRVRQLLGK